MKKILVYIDSMRAAGGIERIVFELMRCWSASYVIELMVKDEGKCFYGDLSDYNVFSLECPRIINMNNRLQRILMTFGNSLISSKRIRKIDLIKYDFFYVTTPMNALELIMAGINTKKIIVSEHGSALGVNKVYKIVKRVVYPKVRCVSVPNSIDVLYYKKIGANAVYIPHLVYLKGKPMNDLSTRVVMNCGRLTADKRQIELLKMWNNIKNKNEWKLIIVGDGEEREKLESFIKENQLTSSVELLPARKEIETIYKKASLFAFTSRFEGFGLVLVEAMSYGIPCIAFDCPSGPRDIVIDGKSGCLIPNNNYEQYETTLEKILNMDEKELVKLGENAYNIVNSWDNNAIIGKWREIFDQ